MKTKVTMKDVVELESIDDNLAKEYWERFCEGCPNQDGAPYKEHCVHCQPRVLPPTRWRKGE